ncbi:MULTISPECIES: hypothetical protein [unclassified Paenibacillus]|uniref:hypothetical protein n=2 Tax=Paenibacillus TaxID=44249 RepID=UPI0024068E66|nr:MULTISPECIES: hypothetical protein [unclassified Paenibacillus]MDF9844269.1 hypothetical protein [Paenibacillus sp. PastF-2]MDF9850942.1 hypothetical protein [Paenibacillus sp. PastM-2]MDH6482780.1 hypothetical protein [Paenibacillus sp. PastH-2]MDH6510206.1 hypothetical protein [Paenibacillus sp. PastM-3]
MLLLTAVTECFDSLRLLALFLTHYSIGERSLIMGLHYIGFILPLLILLPNLLFIFFAPRYVPSSITAPPVIFTILERAGQISCFSLPILFGHRIAVQPVTSLSWLMLICLIFYYMCWVRYYRSGRPFGMLFKPLGPLRLPMAVFPVLYFSLLALWIHSLLFAAAAAVFAIGHLIVSWNTYKQIR